MVEDRNYPDPSYVRTLINRLNRQDALSELFDNALDAGATSVTATFGKDNFVCTDNGTGVEDMNAPVTLGSSGSRQHSKKIGNYGTGAKDGLLSFGTRIKIQTVHVGIAKTYIANFNGNVWPPKYCGEDSNPRFAPADIRDGGTKFTVSDLNDGQARLDLYNLQKQLSQRYYPAIQGGKSIYIVDATKNSPVVLSLTAKVIDVVKEMTAKGEAAGMPFTVLYGETNEKVQNSGLVNIVFKDLRRITTVEKLGDDTLPNRVWIEVILGSEWKSCLSPDKKEIQRHKDVLLDAVDRLIGEWVRGFRVAFEECKVLAFQGVMATKMSNLFAESGTGFNKAAGLKTYGDKSSKVRTPHAPGIPPVEPDDNGTSGGTEKDVPRGHLTFKPVDDLSLDYPYRTVSEGTNIIVLLNKKMPLVIDALVRPYKLKVLWGPICAGVAEYFARRREELGRLPVELQVQLKPHLEYAGMIELIIFRYFYDLCPEISEKEIEEAM